ncbi:heparinase II/III family protein [Streptomyces sp. VRA16 Mangrove soil]|uniref:heparinase II/III domain-containing protein n=1 Tax=Streptomyces sp. VRA16 Mangrove soil TaxID=2817434 RepID=UPI001A9FCE63|nr:heparinase II/III family protein [Streptomyces sp. VRA16 Mangrove soil]MBO1330951.1 heparinase II/III family protein [Streptomyces sp. VRA16 Mangrove soil]
MTEDDEVKDPHALIREAAAAARATAMPDLPFSAYRRFEDDGDRLAYEELYFRRRARVTALAAEALIDSEARLDALADALWSVCDEYTWALPAHEWHATHFGRGMDQCLDLFAALTAQLLGETVRLCGDRLDPRVAGRVRDQVDHRVLTLLADDDRPLLWEDWAHNWAAVCGGAAGLAALALWEPGPRLTRALDRCRAAQLTYLGGFGDDGGCAEGVDYWVFGFSNFLYFAEELREATGEDLLTHPKVAAIARFPSAVHLGAGLFPAFSDAEERPRVPEGLAARLAQRLGVRVPAEAVDPGAALPRDWGDLSRTLRWATAPGPAPEPDPEPATTHLPDLAWTVDRGAGVAFAAKGGHNAEPHNHNDLGQFILTAHGDVLLADLGGGEYRKGYFDDATRYDFLHTSSRGHSVPRVDGCEQSPGAEHAARLLHHQRTSEGVELTLDLTRAYAVDGLTALRRTFSWRRDTAELLLVDEVEATRPMPLEETFVSRLRPDLHADHATWRGTTAQARLALPEGCTAHIEEVRTTDHAGVPDTVYLLRLGFGPGEGRTRLPFRFEVAVPSASPH